MYFNYICKLNCYVNTLYYSLLNYKNKLKGYQDVNVNISFNLNMFISNCVWVYQGFKLWFHINLIYLSETLQYTYTS